MTLLAVTDLPKAGVVSNLDSTMLQMLLDSIESEITARRGPVAGPITEQHLGNVRVISLLRPATGSSGITSVVENTSGSAVTLAADDWLLHPNLMTLFRLNYGSHPADRWAPQVIVTFTPRDDTAERKRVQLAIVKLDLKYEGLASFATSNESRAALANYQLERAALLASFALTGERYY